MHRQRPAAEDPLSPEGGRQQGQLQGRRLSEHDPDAGLPTEHHLLHVPLGRHQLQLLSAPGRQSLRRGHDHTRHLLPEE